MGSSLLLVVVLRQSPVRENGDMQRPNSINRLPVGLKPSKLSERHKETTERAFARTSHFVKNIEIHLVKSGSRVVVVYLHKYRLPSYEQHGVSFPFASARESELLVHLRGTPCA